MAEDRKAQTKAKIVAEAQRQGVDPKLALAVAEQESNTDQQRVGDNGRSVGIFQLQPAAAIDAGIDPARRGDEDTNIRGGVTYLKQKLAQSGGNVPHALSRYNRGTSTYQGIGDPNYERNVLRWYEGTPPPTGVGVISMGPPGTAAERERAPTGGPPGGGMAGPVAPTFLQRVGGWFTPAVAEADDLSTSYVQRKTLELREERRRNAMGLAAPAPGAEPGAAPAAAPAAPPPAAVPAPAPAAAPAAPAAPAPPAAPPAAPPTSTAMEDEMKAALDQPLQPGELVRKLGDYGRQVLGGARDAFVETMQTLNSMGDWLRDRGIGPQWEAEISIPEVREATGFDEQAVRSLSQFLTAFVPGVKAVKGLGVARQITQSMLSGALTDAIAFDPDTPRLSNLLANLPAPLRNPITSFLAQSPDDPEALSRLKNALEGLGLGAVVDALLLAARTMGKARQVKAAAEPAPARPAADLSEEEISAAVASERSAAEARKAERITQTEDALAEVEGGNQEVITRELTAAKALVGDDGRVVLGRGPTLRHFESEQEAARDLLERRLKQQRDRDPSEPMGAVRRALGAEAQTLAQSKVRSGYGTPHPGAPLQVYHGTPAEFATFAPEATRETQYGRQTYWFAEDPEVAGGQAEALGMRLEERAGLPEQPLTAAAITARKEALTEELDRAREAWQQGQMTNEAYGAVVTRVREEVADLDLGLSQASLGVEDVTGYARGGTVRPVFLDIRQPFDTSKPLDAAARARLDAALEEIPAATATAVKQALAAGKTGREVFERLAEGTGSPEAARAVLEEAGFDGIFHLSPTDGRVWVAFRPEQILPAYTPAGESIRVGGAVDLLTPERVQEAQQFLNLESSGVASTLPTEGRAYYVNFDRMNRPEDVRQTVATVAEIVKEQVEAQRRGVQPQAETLAASARSPYRRLDTILGIEPGTVLNAEDATALRATWLAAADRLTELSARVAAGDLEATEDFLKQMVITSAIHTRAVGVTSEMGRAFRMLGVEMPETSRTFLDQFMATVQQSSGVTPQQLAQRLYALPSRAALAQFLQQAEKATGADMVTELWYGALLSNPTTWVVNGLDSAMRTFWAIPERFLAAGVPGSGMRFDEGMHLLYGMKAGVQEAWSASAQMWRTGQSQFGAPGKIDVPLQPALTARNLALGEGTLLGDAVDLLGEVGRAPSRILMTTDEFFKTVNYRMELHGLAFRQAVAEGGDGEAMAQRILALVDDPPPAMHEGARSFANLQTLTQPLDEAGGAFESLGRMTQRIQEAREEWLPLKVMLPFVRTPFNIARSTMERTPFGLFSTNVRRAMVAGGPERAMAVSKMALGSLTMAVGVYLALEGQIVGRRPADKQLADTWERLGIMEYSVKIGDDYVSFNRLEMPGMLFGLAADVATLAKVLPEASLEKVAGVVLSAIFENLSSKTYLRSVGEFVDALTPGSRYEEEEATTRDLMRVVRSKVASVVPSGVAAVTRQMDPVKREAFTLVDQLMARLPGFSEDLPPSRDLWGGCAPIPRRMDQICCRRL